MKLIVGGVYHYGGTYDVPFRVIENYKSPRGDSMVKIQYFFDRDTTSSLYVDECFTLHPEYLSTLEKVLYEIES